VGELPARTVGLIRKALIHSEDIAVALELHIEPLNPITQLDSQSATANAFILAGRQAAGRAHGSISILMMRPRKNADRAIPLSRVRDLIDEQLRSTGDITRLLEMEDVVAVCLEADRPGALAALRRVTKVITANGIALDPLEYSLLELDPEVSGKGTVQRVEEGFQKLTVEPERVAARRVLVVDDEPTVLSVIVEQLQAANLGLDIEATTSGYEACIRFGEFEPDLVMLDIRMPEIDGRDALSTMKKACAGRNVKFMVTSAMPEYFDDMRSRGCDEFLVKPFDLDELVEKVARLLDLDGRAAGFAA
jgi:CheY-like chemotaxis protein